MDRSEVAGELDDHPPAVLQIDDQQFVGGNRLPCRRRRPSHHVIWCWELRRRRGGSEKSADNKQDRFHEASQPDSSFAGKRESRSLRYRGARFRAVGGGAIAPPCVSPP